MEESGRKGGWIELGFLDYIFPYDQKQFEPCREVVEHKYAIRYILFLVK